ncbi:MAG: hypothetical protein S4CHLAM102_08130 [Chlamydiia bacterium]|nr:hypothetical protein [Chlamydiia bacterium]
MLQTISSDMLAKVFADVPAKHQKEVRSACKAWHTGVLLATHQSGMQVLECMHIPFVAEDGLEKNLLNWRRVVKELLSPLGTCGPFGKESLFDFSLPANVPRRIYHVVELWKRASHEPGCMSELRVQMALADPMPENLKEVLRIHRQSDASEGLIQWVENALRGGHVDAVFAFVEGSIGNQIVENTCNLKLIRHLAQTKQFDRAIKFAEDTPRSMQRGMLEIAKYMHIAGEVDGAVKVMESISEYDLDHYLTTIIRGLVKEKKDSQVGFFLQYLRHIPKEGVDSLLASNEVVEAVENMEFDRALPGVINDKGRKLLEEVIALLAAMDESEQIPRFIAHWGIADSLIATVCHRLIPIHFDQAFALSFHIRDAYARLAILAKLVHLGGQYEQTYLDLLKQTNLDGNTLHRIIRGYGRSWCKV